MLTIYLIVHIVCGSIVVVWLVRECLTTAGKITLEDCAVIFFSFLLGTLGLIFMIYEYIKENGARNIIVYKRKNKNESII
jgi:hypothetical protein